ncbi:MAG: tyrosine-type recombinase/integrase [Sulfuriferula sp.]
MASIRKKGDFQWHVQIRRKGFAAVTKTLNTRAEAETWARSVENEMDRGVFIDRSEAEATTLHEALERYEREVSATKKGHEQERWRIRAWLMHPLAKRSMASLRGGDFAKHRDDRLSTGIAPATIKNDLAVISHLFTMAAKEWGLAVSNPVKNIRMPPVQNARERRLESDEEVRLLAAMDNPAGQRSNHWMKPLTIFAMETAMRQSELLSLEWKDVDLLQSFVRARGIGGRSTKNDDNHRDVPLSSRARNVLENLPRSLGGKVFPTTASAVKQAFARACMRARKDYTDECKIKGKMPDDRLLDLHFHDLRHEGTSRLAGKLALHEIMKVTGHKDTRMLARYYHPKASELAKKLG